MKTSIYYTKQGINLPSFGIQSMQPINYISPHKWANALRDLSNGCRLHDVSHWWDIPASVLRIRAECAGIQVNG